MMRRSDLGSLGDMDINLGLGNSQFWHCCFENKKDLGVFIGVKEVCWGKKKLVLKKISWLGQLAACGSLQECYLESEVEVVWRGLSSNASMLSSVGWGRSRIQECGAHYQVFKSGCQEDKTFRSQFESRVCKDMEWGYGGHWKLVQRKTHPGQYGGICFQEPGFGVRITSSSCRYGLISAHPEGEEGEEIRTAGKPLQ